MLVWENTRHMIAKLGKLLSLRPSQLSRLYLGRNCQKLYGVPRRKMTCWLAFFLSQQLQSEITKVGKHSRIIEVRTFSEFTLPKTLYFRYFISTISPNISSSNNQESFALPISHKIQGLEAKARTSSDHEDTRLQPEQSIFSAWQTIFKFPCCSRLIIQAITA